ncbi:MAG TPA: helix-turn-helix domain-containing protein [Candidatus Binataceae bacterium]
MTVVRSLSGSFSRDESNDLVTQNNFVRLSDSDRVRDELQEVAVRPGPRDTATLAIGTETRAALVKVQRSGTTVERISPRDDAWAGLEVGQTLGQLMTKAREHQGFSREQVAGRTNIPAYYVRMIESDSYDAIPDQLYLLPFFQRYAIFLGLDAQQVVSRFIRDFEKAENGAVETPAPSTTAAKKLLRLRQISVAAVIAGILIPCIAWGIGTVRTALRHRADNSPAVAISPHTLPSTDGSRAAAQSPALTPEAPAVTAANAKPQIAQHLHTKPLRRQGRSHRLSRHSKLSSTAQATSGR